MLRRMMLVSLILAMSVCTSNAQNAAKNWIFGQGAWIDFNTAVPTAKAVTTINTVEGSSSISDSSGQLLFYTDGRTVWDKNNNQMPLGFGLKGSTSSTHSALIVPCSCDKYLVLTTGDAEHNYTDGLQYSVVDMNAPSNPGLGDVITKNVPLLSNASEKVAGIRDASGAGFWVVGHEMGTNKFFSYHIVAGSDCRLDPNAAVISPVGAVFSGGSAGFGQGQMKISPNGNWLALAGYSSVGGSFVELFKFSTTTGKVSDVTAGTTARDTSNDGFYGVEFSSTSNYLYATTVFFNNILYSYSVPSALTPRTPIHNYGSNRYTIGALQLAPDLKIYLARKNQQFLDVLPAPDSGGGWAGVQFNLPNGTSSQLGLPTVVAGDFLCTPTSDACCDKIRVSPYPNPPLNQDYRTFEIFNFKQPASPICSIDISMQPLPHTVTWQGGMATWLNNLGASNAANFVFNYKRLPTTGTIAALSVPASAAAVKFNLGFDNTQAYNGITKLTINHCDGTKCVLEYGPWIVNPRTPGGLPWDVEIRDISGELLEVTLTYQGGRGRIPSPQSGKGARWLGLRLLNASAEVYSIDGAGAGDERRKKFSLSSASKTADAALFEFNGLLNLSSGEQTGGTITLLIKKKDQRRIDPRQLSLTLYDENANQIMTGTPQP